MATRGAPLPLGVLRGHSAAVNDLDFGPGNARLVSAAADGEVRIWDLATRRTCASHKGHDGAGVLAVFFGPGQTVCSHGRDGQVVVWDVQGGGWRPSAAVACTSYNFCKAHPVLDVGEALQLALPTEDGKVVVQDLRADSPSAAYGVQSSNKTGLLMTFCITAASPRRYLCAGYESGHVAIWEWQSAGSPLFFERLHEEPVLALESSADQKLLGTGGADNKCKLFQWHHAAVDLLDCFDYSHGASSVAFRSDGRLLAVGCWDHRVRLYDARKRRALALLKHHSAAVNVVKYAAHSDLLAAGSADHQIALWEAYPFAQIPKPETTESKPTPISPGLVPSTTETDPGADA